MKKFKVTVTAIFFFAVVFTISALAQDPSDSTAVLPISGGIPALPPAVTLWGGIAVGIYEVIVRRIPTVKNYSILGWVIRIIQTVIPNKNAVVPTQPHP